MNQEPSNPPDDLDDLSDFNLESPLPPPNPVLEDIQEDIPIPPVSIPEPPIKKISKPKTKRIKAEQENNGDLSAENMYEVIGSKVGTFRFKCSVCSHKSRYKQGIIDHVKQVHRKERPFVCPTCPRSFFRKTDLRIHIGNVHDGNRQWICETCGHACSSKQSLQKHKMNQHTKSPFQCSYCPFVGPSAKRFYNHYTKEHATQLNVPMQYQCDTCVKSFEYESLLKLHRDYEHGNTDKMACDKCGKQFSTKSGLKFHVAGVHEGLKPYVCSQCGKTFPTNGSMQTHIKIVHLKTGSVKCPICSQGVANVFYLRKHCREMHPEASKTIV